jgi:hypothetical protein
MTPFAAADFLAAFQARLACCRALLELSQRQATLIASDDYAELIIMLHTKQSLLEHLGRLAGEQQALREAWPLKRDLLPTDDVQRCNAILDETESLLDAILAEEQASSRLLIARRDATQRELQSIAAGIQTHAAYDSRPGPPLSRIDLNL